MWLAKRNFQHNLKQMFKFKQTNINHCVAVRYEIRLNMLLLYVGAPGLEMAHRLSKQIEAAGKHVMICHDHVMTVLNLYQTLSRTGHPCCEHLWAVIRAMGKLLQQSMTHGLHVASDQRQFNLPGLSHTTAVRPAKLFVLPCEETTKQNQRQLCRKLNPVKKANQICSNLGLLLSCSYLPHFALLSCCFICSFWHFIFLHISSISAAQCKAGPAHAHATRGTQLLPAACHLRVAQAIAST